MPLVEHFLSRSTIKGVQEFFAKSQTLNGVNLNWNLPRKQIHEQIGFFFNTLSIADQKKVRTDIERIFLMSDKRGQYQLAQAINFHEHFKTFKSAIDRAIWCFNNFQHQFERAEYARRYDKYALGQFIKTYQLGDLGKADLELSITGFENALARTFPQHENIIVEKKMHYLTLDEEPKIFLKLFFVNPTGIVLKHINNQIVEEFENRVSDFSLIFSPEKGTFEIHSYRNDYTDLIAQVFKSSFLGIHNDSVPLYSNVFDLQPLLEMKKLKWDSADEIYDMDLQMLQVEDISSGQSVMLHSPLRNDVNTSVIQMISADRRISTIKRPKITHAKFNFKIGGLTANKKQSLPVTIATPNRCDLHRRTSNERRIAENCLERWGLIKKTRLI